MGVVCSSEVRAAAAIAEDVGFDSLPCPPFSDSFRNWCPHHYWAYENLLLLLLLLLKKYGDIWFKTWNKKTSYLRNIVSILLKNTGLFGLSYHSALPLYYQGRRRRRLSYDTYYYMIRVHWRGICWLVLQGDDLPYKIWQNSGGRHILIVGLMLIVRLIRNFKYPWYKIA